MICGMQMNIFITPSDIPCECIAIRDRNVYGTAIVTAHGIPNRAKITCATDHIYTYPQYKYTHTIHAVNSGHIISDQMISDLDWLWVLPSAVLTATVRIANPPSNTFPTAQIRFSPHRAIRCGKHSDTATVIQLKYTIPSEPVLTPACHASEWDCKNRSALHFETRVLRSYLVQPIYF